ncbi:MAG: AraC family ligand binding domain-containing protein, partial [Blautia sp.]
MSFTSLELKQDIEINKIITIHYFEYMSDYNFPGERHDFWEFLCVDKGEVEVCAGNTHHTLKKGEIIFHKPDEFHTVKANGTIAPNLVVISFECHSPCMKYFENLLTSIGEQERKLLAQIIYEAKHCIATPLDDPATTEMIRCEETPFGSE